MNLLNINVENHTSEKLIEDLIDVISDIFTSRNFKVIVSKKFKQDAVNLVIDEFSNQKFLKDFKKFKKKFPDTKFILLNTEFITKRFGFISFNLFSNSPIEILLIKFGLLYLFVSKKIFSEIFKIVNVKSLILLLCSVYEIPKLFFKSFRTQLLVNIRKGIYNYLRYRGFKKIIKDFDYIIHLHPHQNKEKNIKLNNSFLIFPEIKVIKNEILKIKNKSKIILTTTGYKTKFRERILNNLILDQKFFGYQKYFSVINNIDFQDFSSKNMYFLINSPQEKYWPYCSPARLYRSIKKFNTIPIILKNLSQHPLEDLCFELKTPDIFNKIIEMKENNIKKDFIIKLKEYNKIAKLKNDKIFEDWDLIK